ncbi:MAG: hypothetical protein WD572_02425 [Gammaproteobacteria bacterium]
MEPRHWLYQARTRRYLFRLAGLILLGLLLSPLFITMPHRLGELESAGIYLLLGLLAPMLIILIAKLLYSRLIP